MTEDFQIVILAAGKGKRMNSELPKPLHKLGDKTLFSYVYEAAHESSASNIIIVCSKEIEEYLSRLPKSPRDNFVLQEERLGTGHAVKMALPVIKPELATVVLLADTPFVNKDFIHSVVKDLHDRSLAALIIASHKEEENNCGRLVMDPQGNIVKIVEFKDASNEEKKIPLCNSGIMVFNKKILNDFVPKISNNNAANEYYLTDIISLLVNAVATVSYILSPVEIIGINTALELQKAEEFLKKG